MSDMKVIWVVNDLELPIPAGRKRKIPAGEILEARQTEAGGWIVVRPLGWAGLGIAAADAVVVEVTDPDVREFLDGMWDRP